MIGCAPELSLKGCRVNVRMMTNFAHFFTKFFSPKKNIYS
jgi:hypothetical protein